MEAEGGALGDEAGGDDLGLTLPLILTLALALTLSNPDLTSRALHCGPSLQLVKACMSTSLPSRAIATRILGRDRWAVDVGRRFADVGWRVAVGGKGRWAVQS